MINGLMSKPQSALIAFVAISNAKLQSRQSSCSAGFAGLMQRWSKTALSAHHIRAVQTFFCALAFGTFKQDIDSIAPSFMRGTRQNPELVDAITKHLLLNAVLGCLLARFWWPRNLKTLFKRRI
jgi:hypothetical protein